jgi:IS30 family transposase
MKADSRPMTEEEDRWVRVLAGNGLSLGRIAERLNRGRSTIQYACRRLGIKTNGGPGGEYTHKIYRND